MKETIKFLVFSALMIGLVANIFVDSLILDVSLVVVFFGAALTPSD